MIDFQQHRHLAEHIYSSDQDYFFWSSLLGEPFLERDLLYFFDGETISLIGYPVNLELDKASVLGILSNIVMRWISVPSLHFVNYYGPWGLDFSKFLGEEFVRLFSIEPNNFNVDLNIDLTDPLLLKTRNARESIRKTQHCNFELWVGKQPCLSYEHISLIRQLALRESLWQSDVSLLTNIIAIQKSNATTFFELKVNKKLRGFAVAHEYFKERPFLVLAFFDNGCKGASDAIYSAVIEYYRAKGAIQLDLGYSVDEGLYKFKSKWGGIHYNLPFYQFIWMKKGEDGKLTDCLHWANRILVCKSSVHTIPNFRSTI